jgi:anti-sigma factor RsiW
MRRSCALNCDTVRDKLDAYVDGELQRDELAGVDAHLRTCPQCAADALSRMQIKLGTRAASLRYSPSPSFRLRLVQSLAKASRPRWSLARLGSLGWARPLAAAVTLLLIAASAVMWTRHTQREQAIAELLDLHVATMASANPVDVNSTDRHTVKPWFQGRLPFTFNLPELQNSEFKLVGGKVVYLNHRPVAQLLYKLRKHELTVFILEDQPGTNFSGAGSIRERGFSIETWSNGGLRYSVVGDAGATDIHALAELLRAAAHS